MILQGKCKMQYKDSKNKISEDTSYMQLKKNSAKEQDMCNFKIAEEGFYIALVTSIKEKAGKGFHNLWAALNVNAPEREFYKLQDTCNVKKQEQEIVRGKPLTLQIRIEGSGKVQVKWLNWK